MATIYPAQIDTTITLPTVTDNFTPVAGKSVNVLRDAILSIEKELGVQPSGTYGTVKNRLDSVENNLGNLQVISLAGDLGNTLANPYVIGIWGRPISSVVPTLNDVLVWDGIAWVPAAQSGGGGGGGFAGGDLSGSYPSPSVVKIQGNPVLAQTLGSGQNGYLLTWVNADSKWEARPPPSGFSAGGDLTGTATSQTVAKIQGIAISGTPSAGYVIQANSSTTAIWQTPSFAPTDVSPGTAGQIFVTNTVPASAWTSLISYETTHGRFTSGGAGSDFKAIIGPQPGSETTASSLYLLPQSAVAGAENYFLSANGTFGYINDIYGNGLYFYSAASTPLLNLNTSAAYFFTTISMGSANLQWIQSVSSPVITQLAAISDVATQSLTISSQYAYASATGTNRIPGNLVFDIGAPTNSGTTESSFIWTRSGSTLATMQYNAGAAAVELATVSSALEWILLSGGGELILANDNFIVGGSASWWITATLESVGFGSSAVSTSPIVINWTTSTTPTILSGTSATSLTVGTDNSGATLILQGGAATTQVTVASNSVTVASLAGSGSGIVAVNNSGVLSFASGAAPSGSASGDLSGSYPSPKVAKIQGNPVDSQTLGANQDGYVLNWDNTDGYWRAVPADTFTQYFVGIPPFTTQNQTFTIAGTFEFDPTIFLVIPTTIKLKVVGETTGPQLTIQLYNVTDSVVVTGSTLTTTSLTPVELITGDLSAHLHNGNAIYEVQINISSSATINDFVQLDYSRLEVIF